MTKVFGGSQRHPLAAETCYKSSRDAFSSQDMDSKNEVDMKGKIPAGTISLSDGQQRRSRSIDEILDLELNSTLVV